jgi:hypothetical protein
LWFLTRFLTSLKCVEKRNNSLMVHFHYGGYPELNTIYA